VTHVALPTKLEEAEGRVSRAEQQSQVAANRLTQAQALKGSVEKDQRPAAREAVRQAEKQVRETAKAVTKAEQAKAALDTMPREIFKRDTTRENVATSLTMMVMLLVEWVLREYLGDVKMELRTFLELFLYAPTEVRTRAYRILYRLETANLTTERADQLRRACAEITRRKLRRDGRLLIFEAVDRLGQSPETG
jgi:hypothetical protein